MPLSDSWSSATAYQNYMGRWSPYLAELFVQWMSVPADRDWLDVGCGTGALSKTILALAQPAKLVGVDPSDAFVGFARERIIDPRAEFRVGSAQALPVDDASFDVAAAGLVLNFVPDPAAALAEIKRALRPGGLVGAYVWDYSGGMRMIRIFFDAAIALDAAAVQADEGARFPLCQPGKLAELFNSAGLQGVESRALEFTMQFRDFADFWQPFKGGVGPASAYLLSLPPEKQAALEAEVRKRLPIESDGSIRLAAKAWAVKGRK
jgi:SAM-dependent methyltransferase